MSQYLVLSHIKIQNANSVSGLTWGFPAISHFLGFTHALSRKISNSYEGDYDFEFLGCGVVSHDCSQHIYSLDGGYSYRFSQRKFGYTFKPKKKDGQQVDPSIIEEGKMNLTVSLVIEIDKSLTLTTEKIKALEQQVQELCYRMRIAGGTVLNIQHCKLLSASTAEQDAQSLRKIKRLTMPGFVLLDRSDYLQAHYQSLLDSYAEDKSLNSKNNKAKPQLLDAWLDFSALKFKAIPELRSGESQADENTPASWQYVPKPNTGYLAPLLTGYKAISELYEPKQVKNTRDETTPPRFVEAIHSIGEWKGMHSTKDVRAIIWRYCHSDHEEQWYLCKQERQISAVEITENLNDLTAQTQTLNMNEALNQF